MAPLVLGTAGHIDHGKTALVRALTGVDTDRLKEEKERGITIDLGFAELARDGLRVGIVDVPGHEGFVRNMLAGATGVDVVLLTVAADEGVMPQTREHLAIVRLLGVRSLVVALTKVDLVEEAWLELVRDEVEEVLASHGFEGVPLVPTSARTGAGLEALASALGSSAGRDEGARSPEDVARLPVDRAFTVKGTGTVVTGTLWSGTLEVGQRVWLRPGGGPDRSGDVEARVRGLQVHGQDVERAVAGQRTAVALAGADVDLESVNRGQALLSLEAWPETWMITLRAEVLAGTGWALEHNQRVRVHAGTAEVMARVVLLGRHEMLAPGEAGWAQLRLEAPVVVRARERLVLRSYSPVTTIGGGVVAEPLPPKRRHVDPEVLRALDRIVRGEPMEAVRASLELGGWRGVPEVRVPVVSGVSAHRVPEVLEALEADGMRRIGGHLVHASWIATAREDLLSRARRHHREEPLRPGVPPEILREVVPERAPAGLADLLLGELLDDRRLESRDGLLALPGHRPHLDEEQQALRSRLLELLEASGLAPPRVEELPGALARHPDLWPVLRLMESEGVLTSLEEGLFIATGHVTTAREDVQRALGGRSGLGPTDFKDVLPVSRKHLIPLLTWMDRQGITVRDRQGRHVPSGGNP